MPNDRCRPPWTRILCLVAVLAVLGGLPAASAGSTPLDASHAPADPTTHGASRTLTDDHTAAPRIVGGAVALPGQAPWQVAVVDSGFANPFFGQFCGGTLLSPTVVLTAAHCVEGADPDDIDVLAGTVTLSSGGTRVGVTTITLHPDWDPDSFEWDFAVMELEAPAAPPSSAIAFATAADSALWGAGTPAMVTGWGALSASGGYPDSLHAVVVPTVSDATCAGAFGSWFFAESMVCAGPAEGGKDACYGDSGGPMVVPDGQGSWLLAGVVSWGVECALPNLYGVYAQVGAASSWIAGWVPEGAGPRGSLRVTTSPPLPATITVDGTPRNGWGLDWVAVAPGVVEVCATGVQGFVAPPCQSVSVARGQTTVVELAFEPLGLLSVQVEPAGLPATVFVDGTPRNRYGLLSYWEPGLVEVCFGAVAHFTAPPCETVAVTGGVPTAVTGTYTAGGSGGSSAPPLGPHGLLRVTSDPPLPTTISVDNQPGAGWGLDWTPSAVGQHEVCFSEVVGYATPPCQMIEVLAGQTTVVAGTFGPLGLLAVGADPAGLPTSVWVDGVPANRFGSLGWFTPGEVEVCFTTVVGFATPSCTAVPVPPGQLTETVGSFTAVG